MARFFLHSWWIFAPAIFVLVASILHMAYGLLPPVVLWSMQGALVGWNVVVWVWMWRRRRFYKKVIAVIEAYERDLEALERLIEP